MFILFQFSTDLAYDCRHNVYLNYSIKIGRKKSEL